MTNNDQIILDQVLEQQRSQRAPASGKSEFFDMFVAEQELKDYDLSDDEIESGLVGGGGDGGIDGIYTFANGEIVREDFDSAYLKRSVNLDVVIIQSKTTAGYDEDTINRLVAVTRDLFDLSRRTEDFNTVYNESVRSAIAVFRQLYQSTAARFPTLCFRYVYATRGRSDQVHPNVRRKADYDLRQTVAGLFSSARYEFSFRGAGDLLALARRQPSNSLSLTITESISAQGGYIALVTLPEFNKFIRSDTGSLRKNLFESNVRDYQGATPVNEEIQKTLVSKSTEDFWWLNNGITVVANKAVQSGKTLTVEDPQIVNGLQTSSEIFDFFDSPNSHDEKRQVLVRVVEANNPESRDKIIKATNSQTAIPLASLRATDKVHRDIEEYLRPFGFFYDRRKNSHKNDGRSADQIISIPLMAQAVMAIALQRPDDARARPSSLLKRDEDYSKLFNQNYPIRLYLVASKLVKTIHAHLRMREDFAPKERTNLLFYVAMHVAACLVGSAKPSIEQLADVDIDTVTDEVIANSIEAVKPIYESLGGTDLVAKGTLLLPKTVDDLNSRLQKWGEEYLF